jgi:diguanylate cyclase (GGDEF)-like protein
VTAAPIPPDDERRVAALHALNILDTAPEERFDRVTRLAQRVFGTSMASVTLLDSDRAWLKSCRGVDLGEGTPRETSFCAHTILEAETMVVGDARLDERFADNPHVTGEPFIRFYAGHPVAAPSGERLGTLCVFDEEPREIAEFEIEALQELAAMVEAEVASLTLAIGDELTGLSNRRGFDMLGERLLAAARTLSLPVAAVYADLDNMKPINDRFGHEAGDRALIAVGRLLEESLRESDLIARLGGDEFCVLLVGAASADAAGAIARVGEALGRRNAETAEPFELSLSIGIAESAPGEETSLERLVADADLKMLEAKRAKKLARGEGARTA